MFRLADLGPQRVAIEPKQVSGLDLISIGGGQAARSSGGSTSASMRS